MYQQNPYGQQPYQQSNQQQNRNTQPYQNNQTGLQAQNTMNFAAQMSRGRPNYNPSGNYNGNNEVMDRDRYLNSTEKTNTYASGGLEQDARKSFIRKVYTLLSIQLIITAIISFAVMKSPPLQNFLRQLPVIIILTIALIVMSCVISCCQKALQKWGLPILIIFTVIFAFFVGIICAQTPPHIVAMAAGLTALITVALTAYACVTKSDLTGLGPYLLVLSLVLIVFGIVCIFWKNPIVHLVYACLSALLFSVYLLFDTQLVLGKFERAYSLDDAYFASIQLYIDIIEIFLQLLKILSYVNNNN